MKAPTLAELQTAYKAANPDGHFFDRDTMKFFGDTISNFGTRIVVINDGEEVVELYRKKSVKHGLRSSHYFKNGKEVYDVKG